VVAAEDTATGALYVYGFVGAGELGHFRHEGVGGADATVIESDGVAAVASPVQTTDIRLSRRDLRRHLHVIQSVFESTTIIPCAFGTIVDSGKELEDGVLVGGRADLLEGLERLEGTAQMNVKATYDEEKLLTEIVSTDAGVARLRAGTRGAGEAGDADRVRLGEIVAARVGERARLDAARLGDALAALSVDVALEPPERGGAMKGSFLVARRSLAQFESGLEALARAERPLLRFEAIGPLPPTAFAEAYARSRE
jgi:hypothetical protein